MATYHQSQFKLFGKLSDIDPLSSLNFETDMSHKQSIFYTYFLYHFRFTVDMYIIYNFLTILHKFVLFAQMQKTICINWNDSSTEVDSSYTGSTRLNHYNDVIMGAMALQIASLTTVYSTVCSGVHQRKHQTPRHWPLCGEFNGNRWIPRTKGEWRVQCFHLMTSSYGKGR